VLVDSTLAILYLLTNSRPLSNVVICEKTPYVFVKIVFGMGKNSVSQKLVRLEGYGWVRVWLSVTVALHRRLWLTPPPRRWMHAICAFGQMPNGFDFGQRINGPFGVQRSRCMCGGCNDLLRKVVVLPYLHDRPQSMQCCCCTVISATNGVSANGSVQYGYIATRLLYVR
jgi:hypothetical protein